MKHARDVLNELKWREELNLAHVRIFYNDHTQESLIELSGNELKDWDKSFIYSVSGGVIPFHRVEIIKLYHEELYRHSKK
jgi:uncharacterized protein (UPF0248 family)